ncbi:MAG: ComEA family DNA-binding protein [Blastocatellia bacterium]
MGSADKSSRLEQFCRAGCRTFLALFLVTAATFGQTPVDLNEATAAQLAVLPSVGPVLARRIVEHRQRHGRFRRAQDVVAVRGLSARRYRRIAHLLTVK